MTDYGVWEPYAVKAQTVKTAIESACLLLRVDDIVSGVSKRGQDAGGMNDAQMQAAQDGEIPDEAGH